MMRRLSRLPAPIAVTIGILVGCAGALPLLTLSGYEVPLAAWAWFGWSAIGVLVVLVAVRRWGTWLMGPLLLMAVGGPFLAPVSVVVGIAWLARLMLALSFSPLDLASLAFGGLATAAMSAAVWNIANAILASDPDERALLVAHWARPATALIFIAGTVGVIGTVRLLRGGSQRVVVAGALLWAATGLLMTGHDSAWSAFLWSAGPVLVVAWLNSISDDDPDGQPTRSKRAARRSRPAADGAGESNHVAAMETATTWPVARTAATASSSAAGVGPGVTG
jgi:hypothetical protein